MDGVTAGRTFSADPSYRSPWRRAGWICLAAGFFLLLAGAAMLTVGSGLGAWPLLVGFLGLVIGGFMLRGAARGGKSVYRLEVGPEELTVVWRDQVTRLPWAGLQWATVTRDGPGSDDLEVLPEPDFRPVLRGGARPRPSRRVPGQLDVFPLSSLGDAQAECVAEIRRHIPVR